jgi:large subunit ribosomal protein L9
MDIILNQDIKGLGYRYDIVKVRPGYGRNYLIPQGLARIANESNVKERNENVRQAAHRVEKVLQDARTMAEALSGMNLVLPVRVGERGRLFGSITTQQVSEALKGQGLEIDRRKISVPSEMKELGVYDVEVDLHREVKAQLKLALVAQD